MLSSLGLTKLLRRKKPAASEGLTWQQREARVSSELREAENCITKGDNMCTATHLAEANRFEDCPVCQRRISTFGKQFKALPREKQLRKIQLIQAFVQPSAEAHRQIMESDSIRPSRKRVMLSKMKSIAGKFRRRNSGGENECRSIRSVDPGQVYAAWRRTSVKT